MSNHFSAANLKHPGDDARLDLTDVFVFPAPASGDHHHHHHARQPLAAQGRSSSRSC
jgi:hypothetical protein